MIWAAKISSFLGGQNRHVVALNSGTSALHLALKLLNIGSGDVVICQSLSFAASVNPVLYEGATPVFVDSEKETYNLDLEKEMRLLRSTNYIKNNFKV